MQKIQLPECTSTDVFLTAVSAPAAAAGRSAAAGGAGGLTPWRGAVKTHCNAFSATVYPSRYGWRFGPPEHARFAHWSELS